MAIYMQVFPAVVCDKHGHTPATAAPATTKPENNLAVVDINADDQLVNLTETVNEVMEKDADVNPVEHDTDLNPKKVEDGETLK